MRFFLIVMLSGCCSAQIASLKLRNIQRYNDSYPVTGNCLLGDVGSSAWTSDGSVYALYDDSSGLIVGSGCVLGIPFHRYYTRP